MPLLSRVFCFSFSKRIALRILAKWQCQNFIICLCSDLIKPLAISSRLSSCSYLYPIRNLLLFTTKHTYPTTRRATSSRKTSSPHPKIKLQAQKWPAERNSRRGPDSCLKHSVTAGYIAKIWPLPVRTRWPGRGRGFVLLC